MFSYCMSLIFTSLPKLCLVPLIELCHIIFLSVYVLPVAYHLIKALEVSIQLLVSSLDAE